MIYNLYKKNFDKYVESFAKDDHLVLKEHIELKRCHTIRVRTETVELCKHLGMTDKEIAFCEVIAILHDLGRFEQFKRYGTFSDANSENHSQIAMRIIEEENFLSNFPIEHINIILKVIMNHNTPGLPSNITPEVDFYSRILRDADKLDIWNILLSRNFFHSLQLAKLPEVYEVPPHLLTYFEKEKAIPLAETSSFYDSVLFRLSWIYDLNFEYSIDQFRQRNYCSAFIEKLPPSSNIERISNLIMDFIQ